MARIQRFGAALFVALASIVLAARAAAAEPAPAIIAVGDLHGDYEAYVAILRSAGLIDKKGKWSGGDSVLVQLGDVPDRGPDTKKIIEHLMKLESQASREGGRVEALIGNHEAMNVTGDLRYVTRQEYAAFATSKSKRVRAVFFKKNFLSLAASYRLKDPALTDAGVKAAFEYDTPLGYLEHRAAWSVTGKFGAWVASHDAVAQIGDTLFVHGGLGAPYASMSLDAINAAVRAALINGGGAILEDAAGPLWHRGFAQESAQGEAELAAALTAFGAKRLVIGHTPQPGGVKALYGGRVIVADTGASKAYGGTRSFLRIEQTGIFANDNDVVTDLAAGAQ